MALTAMPYLYLFDWATFSFLLGWLAAQEADAAIAGRAMILPEVLNRQIHGALLC
jgi:hypothetical protein